MNSNDENSLYQIQFIFHLITFQFQHFDMNFIKNSTRGFNLFFLYLNSKIN
jgi:hypothetical protein